MDTPAFPQDLSASFPGVGAGALLPPPLMADTLPHATTGRVFHSCLMDCLTSGLGCIVSPSAGVPAWMPQPLLPPPQMLVLCNVESANPLGMPTGMDVGLASILHNCGTVSIRVFAAASEKHRPCELEAGP